MNELIIIAKALEQIANELAEIKYILKYKDNEPCHEGRRTETEHGPTNKYPQETGCYAINKEMTYDEFRRLAQ